MFVIVARTAPSERPLYWTGSRSEPFNADVRLAQRIAVPSKAYAKSAKVTAPPGHRVLVEGAPA